MYREVGNKVIVNILIKSEEITLPNLNECVSFGVTYAFALAKLRAV